MEAAASFEQALTLNATDSGTQYNWAVAVRRIRPYADALRIADQAIRRWPSFDLAYYLRGRMLMNMGHYEESLKALEQAIALRPDFQEYRDGWRMVNTLLGKQ